MDPSTNQHDTTESLTDTVLDHLCDRCQSIFPDDQPWPWLSDLKMEVELLKDGVVLKHPSSATELEISISSWMSSLYSTLGGITP